MPDVRRGETLGCTINPVWASTINFYFRFFEALQTQMFLLMIYVGLCDDWALKKEYVEAITSIEKRELRIRLTCSVKATRLRFIRYAKFAK
jgi:hypothetical protein